MTVQTWLIEIAPEDCADLLAGSSLGRLGVVVDGRPEIYPISYVYERDTGCVAFPTNTGAKLHGALDWPWVAFEVDGLEGDDSGWSVLIVGRAEEVADAGEIADLTAQRHVLWRSTGRLHWVRIVPSKTTGRRIEATS